MAETKFGDTFFRQSLESCAALATRWPSYLCVWFRPTAAIRKPVGGLAAATLNNFLAAEAYLGRPRLDLTCQREPGWESSDLAKGKLVTECVHHSAGGGRHSCSCEQATDAGRE